MRLKKGRDMKLNKVIAGRVSNELYEKSIGMLNKDPIDFRVDTRIG